MNLSGPELVGYLASALVVIALTRASVVRLRMFSLVGSITFTIYGSLIGSPPIIITNTAIAIINIWFLRKEFAGGSDHGIDLGVSHIRADSPFLRDFVDFHLDDIHRFQPKFTIPQGDDAVTLLLTRDGLPAGMVIGRRVGTTLKIDLDYVLSRYRDSRLGRWLYREGADVFRADGYTTLISSGSSDTHRKYLERVGFEPKSEPTAGAQDIFELQL
jgi:hypothetical protein